MAVLSAGTVTVTLQAVTAGFGRQLAGAAGQLKALQKQVVGIANSFKFIGGFAALGGIAAAVESLTAFQDNLGALKGVLSGTIKDSKALDFNVGQLGINARRVALDTGFLASELVAAEVEFVRAGISAKATAENLRSVANLARTENIGVAQAAEVATNILLGFNLSADQFTKVVDLIVSAANTSSSSVLELAQSFKLSSAIAVDFGQSAESLASELGVLANAGVKGSMAGTTLRQIFKVLVDDFNKGDSVLKRFGISLFKGGETSQTVTSEFRTLTDILGDLRKNAGTADEFIKIFQSRALSGSLILSRQTSEELAKLAETLGKDVGSAARIGAFRLETLAGQFGKLKAAAQEFVLALGFQGGLLTSLTAGVQQVTAFVTGLATLRPKFLQLIGDLIVAASKTFLFTGAFVALGGAAALALSPLGSLIVSLTALSSGPSLLQKYGPELMQLGDLFLSFAKTIGANFASFLVTGLATGFTFLFNKVDEIKNEGNILQRAISGTFAAILNVVSGGLLTASDSLSIYADEQQKTLDEQLKLVKGTGLLSAAISQLDAGTQVTKATYDVFAQTLSKAQASVGEVKGELTKLFSTVKSKNNIPELIRSIEGISGSGKTVADLKKLSIEFVNIESNLESVRKSGTPSEILGKGTEQLTELLVQVNELGLRPFDIETNKIVGSLQILRGELEATGSDPRVFDPIIQRAKELRAQLDTVTVDLAAGFRDGFRSAIQGVLQGTRELDFGAILKQGLVGAFTEAFDKVILEKFKFDAVFKKNFIDLGEFARTALSGVANFAKGLFGGGDGGAAASVGKGIGGFLSGIFGGGGGAAASASAFSAVAKAPVLGKGGIITSPTLAMVGDVNEAVIPLDRLRDFGGGSKVSIQVVTVESPENVSMKQSSGADGQKFIELVVGASAKSVTRGGALRQALSIPQVER